MRKAHLRLADVEDVTTPTATASHAPDTFHRAARRPDQSAEDQQRRCKLQEFVKEVDVWVGVDDGHEVLVGPAERTLRFLEVALERVNGADQEGVTVR